jgi:hypothetical protein
MASLNNELEEAFANLIGGAISLEANVYTGKSSGDKALPCVICAADGDGEEDPKGTGNFWVRMSITMRASAATLADGVDPKPASVQLVSDVHQLVYVDDLPAQLNSQGRTLTVFPQGIIFDAPKSGWDDLGAWVDEISARVYCCASVLAA